MPSRWTYFEISVSQQSLFQGKLTEIHYNSVEAKGPFEEEAGSGKSLYGKFHGEFHLLLLEISLIISLLILVNIVLFQKKDCEI